MSSLVFIHSTGLGPFMWSPYLGLAPGVAELRPYNLGSGPSGPVQRPQRVGLQDEVEHLRAQLAGHGPLHLVAHSWGATVALALAQRRDVDVASLWLYEPVLFGSLLQDHAELDAPTRLDLDTVVAGFRGIDDRQGGGEAWLEAFVDYWNGRGAWQAMGERARDAQRQVGWKMFQEVRAVFEDTAPFAAYASAIPTMLLVGSRSPRPAQAMARRLAAHRQRCTLQEMPELGHMGVLSAWPALRPLLEAHLQRQQLLP